MDLSDKFTYPRMSGKTKALSEKVMEQFFWDEVERKRNITKDILKKHKEVNNEHTLAK